MVGNFIEVGIWQNLESALLTVYSIGEMKIAKFTEQII